MRRIPFNLNSNSSCSEHGTRGSLPCAWPECPNGIHEDEFEEEARYSGATPDVWKRRKWNSPLGGEYFSWESRELPNWFHATQIFWNEARRLQLISESYPDTVYHYTSLEGFLGIVKSRSVWMTDFAYLNDRREVRHGVDLMLDAVGDIANNVTQHEVQTLLSAWQETLAVPTNRICITSFSGDGDSLSQWRAYGPIAIGFPVGPLSLHVNQSRLQPIEYDPLTQKRLAQIYVHHLVSAFEADRGRSDWPKILDQYYRPDRLLELAIFFKDPAFRSENEYRLAYVDNPEIFGLLGFESPPRLFRVAGGRIVPYVPSSEVLKSEIRQFPLEISEVVLGPESDELLEQGVREFLSDSGLPNVHIRRSLVPLR